MRKERIFNLLSAGGVIIALGGLLLGFYWIAFVGWGLTIWAALWGIWNDGDWEG